MYFTSGGTESNNWAIKGAARANTNFGNHIITTAIEHPAVTEVLEFLKGENFEVSTVKVDSTGRVDPNNLISYVNSRTTLVSVSKEDAFLKSFAFLFRNAHFLCVSAGQQ